MMKDRNLKMDLVRYFLRKQWYPQLEVDVLSRQRISSTKKLITDVDVLGLYTDASGLMRLLLGDCKTLKGQSPITRTLWMKGLMDYLEADKAIIILSKEIEKEHQLTSHDLNVQLLSENDFRIFSTHTADYVKSLNSALAIADHWDAFFDIISRFPRLGPLLNFSKSEFWNEPLANNKLRHSLFVLKSIRSELNPANALHLVGVLNHFSLVAIALNDIINKIFNRYLLPTSKTELENDLKIIIWGGFDNYEYLNDLRRRFSGAAASDDLSLPEWNRFIEFIRYTLERPLDFSQLALFLKEIAFSFFSTGSSFSYAEELAKTNRYLPVFALRLSEYLCEAVGLPPEFQQIFQSIFIKFQ